jgi:hypothetical protein
VIHDLVQLVELRFRTRLPTAWGRNEPNSEGGLYVKQNKVSRPGKGQKVSLVGAEGPLSVLFANLKHFCFLFFGEYF